MKLLKKDFRRVYLLILLITALTHTAIASDWNPLVKSDDRVISFMIQLSSLYNIPLPNSLYQQPLHRKDVANFLEIAISGDELNKVERETAEQIFKWYGGDRTLFSRTNDHSRINVNLDLSGDIDLHFKDSLAYGAKGIIAPSLNGHIGPISFASQFDIWTETRNDTLWQISDYEPYSGNPYNLFDRDTEGNVRSSDKFRASVSYKKSFISADIGVDNLRSGPALKNRLTLNLDKMPALFLRYNFDFKWINYTHIVGSLKSMKEYKKYFAYHRIEAPLLNKKFRIGINEVIIYGSSADSTKTAMVHPNPLDPSDYNIDRDFEPIYAIPFIPFAFAEHYNGDRDNALLSFDFSLRLPKYFYWYLEFLLDDMSNPTTLFSDDFGNKWGLTAGGMWSYNFLSRPFTTTLEYSRIEPWVYTHFKGVSHRYTHFGESGGGALGPNSDQLWGEITYQVSKLNKFSFAATRHRWDHTYRGGDIEDVFITEQNSKANGTIEDSKTKEFLSGNVLAENIFELGWKLLPYQIFEVDTKLSHSSINGFGIAFYGGFRF